MKIENALAVVLIVTFTVQHLLTIRFAPILAWMYDEIGMLMPLPTRMYLELAPWSAAVAAVIVLLWIAFAAAGRPWPARVRRAVLSVGTAIVTVGTLIGIYYVTSTAIIQASRERDFVQNTVVRRNITDLQVVGGPSREFISTLDARVSAMANQKTVWTPTAEAVLLGDAYAQQGSVEKARWAYTIAKESAAKFEQAYADETTKRAGLGLGWGEGPSDEDVKQLSTLLRAVADRRLQQLAR